MTHYLSDAQIAQAAVLSPIASIAEKLELSFDALEPYGKYKAKLDVSALADRPLAAKLILVTAINPTPAGEGKTTTSIGLGDGLNRIGKQTVIALREPSLGPVFGMKGGAAGGGYAQVIPMEDINLHFTGDFHAISAANNLLAAIIDNHIHQGNALGIDPATISWKRVVDMNDRQLRHIVSGLGGASNGYPREDGYDITVASEVMAVLCLAKDLVDLKERLGRIVVANTTAGEVVKVSDLGVQGAMAALLKEAIKPNLVQTLEHNPVLIHGGPFANIAHGCNSVIATRAALQMADYVVTEAGFGADLGAQKFMDIKARELGKLPDAVVIVATVRALKMHGGVKKEALEVENVQALIDGMANLMHHIKTMKDVYQLPIVVAINVFPTDTETELQQLERQCESIGVRVARNDSWAKGGQGAEQLANTVVEAVESSSCQGQHSYDLNQPLTEKIESITRRIYGGHSVVYAPGVKRKLRQLEEQGYGDLPICMAKTQYSLSDNPRRLGAPSDFDITVRAVRLAAGAGFVVALTGDVMTMPGLPKVPAAQNIDIDEAGMISGLF